MELYEHQRHVVDRLAWEDSFAVFMEMRTGKTLTMLTHVLNLIMHENITQVLVIAPKAGIAPWMRDIDKFPYPDSEKLRNVIKLVKITSLWENVNSSGHRAIRPRKEYLRRWDAVIVDESHTIGRDSSQSRAVRWLTRYADRRYILTGTPYAGAKFDKLFYQFQFIDPDIFGRSFNKYKARFALREDYFGKVLEWRTDELMKIVREHAVQVRLCDCYDMPEILPDEIIECPLEEKTIYKRIKNGSAQCYHIDPLNAGGKWTKLMQVCSGHYLDDDGITHYIKTSKQDALSNILETIQGKVVIFAWYTASVNRVAEIVRDAGLSSIVYDDNVRVDIWREFQKDDTRVFISQYARGSASIDLFSADTVIFYEPVTSAELHEQARARIMAVSKRSHLSYIYLVTSGTMEERILDSVRNGRSVSIKVAEEWANNGN